jgi:hypothetical protein
VISIIGHNSGPSLVNVWHRECQGQAEHVLEGEKSRNAVIPSPLTDNRWKWQTRFVSLRANKEAGKLLHHYEWKFCIDRQLGFQS